MADKFKTPAQSRAEQSHLIMYGDVNAKRRLFGGQLMRWIDEIAGVAGRRHSEMDITTAAVDNLQFLAPAHLGDTVVLVARVTWVGNSSMEARVDTYVEKLSGERAHINRARLVMVALDENEAPARVPRLRLETDEERQEFEEARLRRGR